MLSKKGEKGLRSKQQEKYRLMEVKYKSGLMWQCEIGVPLRNIHKNPHPVSLFPVDAATLTSLLYTRIMARIIEGAFREMCNQQLQVNQLNSSRLKHRGLPDSSRPSSFLNIQGRISFCMLATTIISFTIFTVYAHLQRSENTKYYKT